MYSINVHVCYFTQIALTVVLLCYFQGVSLYYFGGNDGDSDSDGSLVSLVSQIVAWMIAHRYV